MNADVQPSPIELRDYQRDFLASDDLLSGSVTIKGRSYTLHEAVGHGVKSVVWRASDDYGRDRAIKFAIADDYEERSYLSEFHRVRALEPHEQFAKLYDADLLDLEIGDEPLKVVAFVEEWVSGKTLRFLLDQHSIDVTETFLVDYISELCGALNALRVAGLRHDDLHPGNVMIADQPPGSLDKRLRLRVIDMGSLKPIETPTRKRRDDHGNLVDHIVLLHNAMVRNPSVSHRRSRFLEECRNLLTSMLDLDPTVCLTSPEQISAGFRLAHTRSLQPARSTPVRLNDPFEFISAEHLADDRVLVEIFAKSCPWLPKVQSNVPCLLVGPRGCGKSTIFRWLSLRAHLHKETILTDEFTLSGFYLSCMAMQNRLGLIRTDALAERFHHEIVHYFNMLLAREVLQTLAIIVGRPDRETLWGFGEQQEISVYEYVEAVLPAARPYLQGVSRVRRAVELVESEINRCHSAIRRGVNIDHTTDEAFLGDFTEYLTASIPFFRVKPITFLLDDYSDHRLPPRVQRVLNRVIWERRSSHLFKLSSEKYGTDLVDSDGAPIDTTRELLEIDCGREFLTLNDAEARAFAVELLTKRLESAGYAGSPEALLGPSEWKEGSLAAALRAKQRGRNEDQYHGLDCIANICSGDVSTLLEVFRRIFDVGDVTKGTISQVPKYRQHQAIESVSRELLQKVRHHHTYGSEMYAVLLAFGQHVRTVLVDGQVHTNREIPQIPRIEVDDVGAATDKLSSSQSDLATELLRRAIFIEMEPGRSRRAFATTVRWQLRRVYLPAFKAALAKNDAVKFNASEFKFFLSDPAAACNLEWSRRRKTRDRAGAATSEQLPLEVGGL